MSSVTIFLSNICHKSVIARELAVTRDEIPAILPITSTIALGRAHTSPGASPVTRVPSASTVARDHNNTREKILGPLSHLQVILFFCLVLAVLGKSYDTFGSMPLCNVGARVAFFSHIKFHTAGHSFSFVLIYLMIAAYITIFLCDNSTLFLCVNNYFFGIFKDKRKRRGGWIGIPVPITRESTRRTTNSESESETDRSWPKISGTLVFDILAITLVWVIMVINTELLIQWNKFKRSEESQWSFGQVSLPRILY